MNGRWLASTVVREARGMGGRLVFFAACLATGVAAVVAVAGLSSAVTRGLRAQARPLLGGDVAVESYRPLPPSLDAAVASLPGARRTDVVEMVTVAATPGTEEKPGKSQIVELKVVGTDYPFYGQLVTSPPGGAALLASDAALVGPELLSRLGIETGGTFRLGNAAFRAAGVILEEPDRMLSAFSIGPRVLVSPEGLARAGLVRFGSRVSYRALLRLPDGDGQEHARAAASLRAALGDAASYVKVETYAEAQPALRQGISRVDRFVGLVGLLSLLVGGVGVAQTIRAHLATRLDAIAVYKCLGVRPREVFALFVAQVGLLSVLASLAGAALGLAVLALAPRLLGDLLPTGWVDPWQPAAVLRGLAVGVPVALLFSLSPVAAALRVPPVRVLRRDVEALPPSRVARAGLAAALLLGTWGVASLQARSGWLGAGFVGGLLAATGALAAVAWGLVRFAARVPRDRVALTLRRGLAALARPGAGTIASVVALGLGVLVVLALTLVERHLSAQLAADLPKEAPTAFLVDVQPDQWAGVAALLEAEGATRIDSVPVVMARLDALDGRRVAELSRGGTAEERERRGWALTREQRLTYGATLPKDNVVVAGSLWSRPDVAEVSLEKEFAEKSLRVGLGSRLTFDVQGVPLVLTVTSLRTVDWRTFGINFFFVVEPGVLEKAPQARLAAARLPREKEEAIQARLAREFPNVTAILTREVLEKIAGVVSRLGVAVRFLGGFTVLAGVILLGGAVSAGAARRSREAALLKVLGFTRGGVAAAFAVEYAAIGLAAGAVGTAGGAVLSWFVVTRGFEMAWRLEAMPLLVAVLGTAALAVAAGLGASGRALAVRPLEALRHE